MGKIKLSLDDIYFINLFERITKVNVKDCILNDEKQKITFVVEEGFAGKAIGKGGSNVKKLEEKLKRKVEIIEFSKDPIKFIYNLFRPVKLRNAYISEKSDGKKTLHVTLMKDKFGVAKAKAKYVKELVSRYYDFDEIIFS